MRTLFSRELAFRVPNKQAGDYKLHLQIFKLEN